MGSCALSGKMLLVRIVENAKLMLILRQVRLIKCKLCPHRVRKEIRIGPCRVRAPSNYFNNPRSLTSLNQEVHLIQIMFAIATIFMNTIILGVKYN